MGYFRTNVGLLQEQECARGRGSIAGITKPSSGDIEEAQSEMNGFGYMKYSFLGRQYV